MKPNALSICGLTTLIFFSGVLPLALGQQKDAKFEFNEKQEVLAIYEATKTVKSAKEYTELIEQCDRVLEEHISTKNQNYVQSLKGWALNRRGSLRFDTAMELSDIGNSQSQTAMEKAFNDFDEAIELAPDRWRSWKSRGIAFASQAKFDAAIKDFSKAIDLKPDDVDCWFNRAEARYHLGDYANALTDYDSVLAMEADDLESLTGRGHAYFSLAKYPEAQADYQRVVAVMPNNSDAWINVGDAKQMLGEWRDAENAYAKALKLNSSPVAMQRMAWFKSTCADVTFHDPTEAFDLIEKAIALNGETAINLDTLAAVQAARGEFKTAKATQEKVIQLVEAQVDADSSQPYKTRLAMYEEGVSFRQEMGQSDAKDKASNAPKNEAGKK